MPCYRPNYVILKRNQKGSWDFQEFLSGNNKIPDWYEQMQKTAKQMQIARPDLKYVKIPCKQCIGCQEKYSKEWAVRCLLESEKYKWNFFVTLTYDDYHLPCESEIVDEKTGEIFEDKGDWYTGHLKKDDLKDFIDDLRDYYRYHYGHTGIKYFACGEYGSETQRPHYHIILFNLPKPPDLKVYKIQNGSVYYTSDLIKKKIWKDKGFITLGEVNWDTCAYTARYVMKKMNRRPERSYYEEGQIPEFIRMSNKPGIASDCFDEAMFNNDEIIIRGHRQKIEAAKPPEYFMKKFAILHPHEAARIRDNRQKIAERVLQAKMLQTDKTVREQLQTEERSKMGAWKSLARKKI